MTTPFHEPDLLDYQRADAALFRERLKTRVADFCTWEPGLGKSLLAFVVHKRLGYKRLLVTCPSIALVSWREQLDEWWPGCHALIIDAGAKIKKLEDSHQVVVVTHDLLRKPTVRAPLREWAEDQFAVVDEAQYLRGPATQRTAAAYRRDNGLLVSAARVLLMSGTPVVSWPDDLWTHLARWWPERILNDRGTRMEYEEFRDYFMLTRRVPIPGTHQHRIQIYGMMDERRAELKQRIEGIAIRRTKSETDLPPLTWRMMPLELSAADRKAMHNELVSNLPERFDTLMAAAQQRPDDAVLQQRLMDALTEYHEYMAVAMRILGVGKAKALCRVLNDRLDNSQEAIGVFAINHAVMDVIDADLKKKGTVRIDGQTTPAKRTTRVGHFMDPTGPRVFNGQIQACGTALTLTRASTVFFPQMSWIPGENNQAASRFHRQGQHNPVTAWVPYVKGTLDMPLMQVLRKKTEAAMALVDM